MKKGYIKLSMIAGIVGLLTLICYVIIDASTSDKYAARYTLNSIEINEGMSYDIHIYDLKAGMFEVEAKNRTGDCDTGSADKHSQTLINMNITKGNKNLPTYICLERKDGIVMANVKTLNKVVKSNTEELTFAVVSAVSKYLKG